jgi:phosphoenolpyruvate carboxylase
VAAADRLLRAPHSEAATAAELQSACRELLPRYAHALREPERWAVLTRACLERRPVERTGEPGPAPAERFDELALGLLVDPDAELGSVLITGVEQASDMLCALWLARRSGLFHPGTASRGSAGSRGWAGSRSRLGLVPAFAPASLGHAAYTLATLYANAAYKRHLAARGNAQRVALQAADSVVQERLARQARSWGVELSV